MHITITSYMVEIFNCWSILNPLITVLLCLLSVFVVLGNSLVVSAIWHENQLHSVTNYLIASLAASDCLVGAVVMPFSILSEIIIGSWTFGALWCDLWHSFDVLASTASIMNLCAISLDRYLAITDPISYPARMTPKRVALLIVSLWTCSSLISFPAIIWWRSVGQGSLQKIYPPTPTIEKLIDTSTSNKTMISSNLPVMIKHQQPIYKCVFTDDTYYLLFSSIVSFYGPLCVMLYAYYRIYKAAIKQTRFLKHGSKQVMLEDRSPRDKNGGPNSNLERQQVVLRAHRGGGGNYNNTNKNNKIPISKQCSSITTTTITPSTTSNNENLKVVNQLESTNEKGQILFFDSGKLLQSIVDLNAIDYIDRPEKITSSTVTNEMNDSELPICCSNLSETTKTLTVDQVQFFDNNNNNNNNNSDNRSINEAPITTTRQHKSVGRKLSRLAKERKAAKTLGIVVGVFILCWLPFFVVNIIVALCGSHCIYKVEILLAVVTWLGYINSAMNPVIYACWSRDFRRAFRKVLCTWIEFLCPYKHACLVRKLKLKTKMKTSQHHQQIAQLNHLNQDIYLSRNLSSFKGNNSSSSRAGVSIEVHEYNENTNGSGGASLSLLTDQQKII